MIPGDQMTEFQFLGHAIIGNLKECVNPCSWRLICSNSWLHIGDAGAKGGVYMPLGLAYSSLKVGPSPRARPACHMTSVSRCIITSIVFVENEHCWIMIHFERCGRGRIATAHFVKTTPCAV